MNVSNNNNNCNNNYYNNNNAHVTLPQQLDTSLITKPARTEFVGGTQAQMDRIITRSRSPFEQDKEREIPAFDIRKYSPDLNSIYDIVDFALDTIGYNRAVLAKLLHKIFSNLPKLGFEYQRDINGLTKSTENTEFEKIVYLIYLNEAYTTLYSTLSIEEKHKKLVPLFQQPSFFYNVLQLFEKDVLTQFRTYHEALNLTNNSSLLPLEQNNANWNLITDEQAENCNKNSNSLRSFFIFQDSKTSDFFLHLYLINTCNNYEQERNKIINKGSYDLNNEIETLQLIYVEELLRKYGQEDTEKLFGDVKNAAKKS